jgi:DNA repair photolyase
MGLNKSNGNMYEWVTHTWNTIKGKCPHDCDYCYMKKWGKQPELHFDKHELKTHLGAGNVIFVGSSCDMFAEDIHYNWIHDTLNHCLKFSQNTYLFQSKNPGRIANFYLPESSVICTTIETNRWYPEIMKNCPYPEERSNQMCEIDDVGIKTYVTIEPILDFDRDELIHLIGRFNPAQVNIGADSGGHKLPEPSKEKIIELISELEKFTIVKQKKNLNRLLK